MKRKYRGTIAKGGINAKKPGVKSQRPPHNRKKWGIIAKAILIGGQKRKGKYIMKSDTEKGWRNKNRYYKKAKMVGVITSKGYYNYHEALTEVIGGSVATVTSKLNTGRFTWEETIKITRAFRFTFTEFYSIFLDGLYDRDGNLIKDPAYKELPDRS